MNTHLQSHTQLQAAATKHLFCEYYHHVSVIIIKKTYQLKYRTNADVHIFELFMPSNIQTEQFISYFNIKKLILQKL